MKEESPSVLPLQEIAFSNMEYLAFGQGLLMWKKDSRYLSKDKGGEPKSQFFSIKGIIEVKNIDGVTCKFDAETNQFEVFVFFNGFHTYFTTKKSDEAEYLYDLLMAKRFGVWLKEPELDLPI